MRRIIPIALGIATCALTLGACFDDPEPVTGMTSGASSDTTAAATDAGGTTGAAAGDATADDESTSGAQDESTSGVTDPGTDTTGEPNECLEPCFTGRCDNMGRCVRAVFVTSRAYPPDFGNASGADMICNMEAMDAGLGGRFAALIATNDNLGSAFQHAAIAINAPHSFSLPGQQFVGISADLRPDLNPNAVLAHAIDRGPAGVLPGGGGTACENFSDRRVWTGLRSPIEVVETGPQCSGWTGMGNGSTGVFDQLDAAWLASQSICPCVDPKSSEPATARLYCVEVPQP